MEVLYYILISTFLISLIAFIGVLSLAIKKKLLKRILLFLVSLAAGALMGGAFLHLIPEALEKSENIFLYVLAGFILFFFIEKALHWHHCVTKSKVKTLTYMNLLGDGVHNFIDGLIIAAGFVANFQLGIVTSVAVALHEIPQELGDFGVLVYGGFKVRKALFFNFLSALTAIVGGVIGYYLLSYVSSFVVFLLPFAAGGFIYIGASDLIPEIRKVRSLKKSLINFGIFILGILIMYGLRFI